MNFLQTFKKEIVNSLGGTVRYIKGKEVEFEENSPKFKGLQKTNRMLVRMAKKIGSKLPKIIFQSFIMSIFWLMG